jgi:mannose-6-phosphate isomerase-like protein (cupin superfamily)
MMRSVALHGLCALSMKLKRLRFGEGFRVVPGNRRSQAAEMVIPPGDAEGDASNRHRGADQWLYVLAGSGQALVKGRRHKLRKGILILIERGERHEIRNTGRGLLRTLNVYVPPAYAKGGDPLPRGRR